MSCPNPELLKELVTRAFELNRLAKEGNDPLSCVQMRSAVAVAVKERMSKDHDWAIRNSYEGWVLQEMGRRSRMQAQARKKNRPTLADRVAIRATGGPLFNGGEG